LNFITAGLSMGARDPGPSALGRNGLRDALGDALHAVPHGLFGAD
jgi:hypothetical protein